MATATFDTLKFANTLKAAGVPPQQAEAQAIAFGEALQVNLKDLVTKDDLKVAVDALRQEIKAQGDSLRQEIKAQGDLFRQEMKNIVDAIRHEIKESEQRLKAQIDVQKTELVFVKWLIGVVFFSIVGLIVRSFAFRGGP